MADLLELATRCEAATGADARDLLNEAFRAVYGAKPARVLGGSPEWLAWLDRYNPFFRMLEAGAYLDAAMTLVPEGHEWIRKSPRSMTVYRVPADDKTWALHHDAPGATPALALCAAALRARAALASGVAK